MLTALVEEAVGGLEDRVRRTLVVDVLEHDGLKWSATAASRSAGAKDDGVRLHHLAGDRGPGVPPAVAELVDEERLRKLAVAEHLLPRPRQRDKRRVAVVGAIAIVLGAAALLLGQVVGTAAAVLSPSVVLVALLIALVTRVGDHLWSKVLPGGDKGPPRPLAAALGDAADHARDGYERWVDRVAAELARAPGRRCVVVAGYDRLDRPTRDVLFAYLAGTMPESAGEAWVVFDRVPADPRDGGFDGAGDLTNRLLWLGAWQRCNRSDGRSEIKTAVYVQQPLTNQRRSQLAEEVGDPRRAALPAVGDVAGGDRDLVALLERLLDSHRATHPAGSDGAGPLELLHVLALKGEGRAFAREDVARDLSSSGARRVVLEAALNGMRPARTTVQRWFDALVTDLGLAVDADGRSIRVTREAAHLLREHRERWLLPSPRLVHLFWALHDDAATRGRPSFEPDEVLTLGRHLLGVDDPAVVLDGFDAELRIRFFESCLLTAERLIKISRLRPVPHLLEFAAGTLPENDASAASRLGRLSSLAYALLGDDRVLGVLLFSRGSQDDLGGPHGEPDPLDRLFAESLSDGWSGSDWRTRLLSALRRLDPEVRGWARVRAFWLALVVPNRGPWDGALVDDALAASTSVLTEVVPDAVRRLDDPGRQLLAADVMTASVGVWCSALVLRELVRGTDAAGEPMDAAAESLQAFVVSQLIACAELLGAAYAPSDDLRKGLRSAKARGDHDFPRDALAEELSAMIGASAHVVADAVRRLGAARTWPEEVDDVLADLDQLIEWAVEEPQPNPARALQKRLGLVRFTWERLGFSELADGMALRWAHFYLLVEDVRREETLERVLGGIAALTHAKGAKGVMANAIAARGAEDRLANAAPLVRDAVEAALDGLGSELVTDLCVSAVALAHAQGTVELTHILQYLVDEDPATGCRLRHRLERLPDHRLPGVALMLLNAASQDARPEVASLVPEALRERAEMADDREARRRCLDEIELSRLERETDDVDVDDLVARWRGATWTSFARVLLRALARAGPRNDLLEEATKLLADHPGSPPMSAPVTLAFKVAVHSLPRADPAARVDPVVGARFEIAVRYLEEAVPEWEQQFDPYRNVDYYRFLSRHAGSGRAHYIERLHTWQVRQQEHFELSRLRRLLRQGAHFRVFWHYVSTLEFQGLVPHPDVDPVAVQSAPPEEVQAILAGWRGDPDDVPPAIVEGPRGRQVGGHFVRRGYWLFDDGTPGDEPELDVARRNADHAAQEALDELFDIIAALPDIPPGVKRILAAHRRLACGVPASA